MNIVANTLQPTALLAMARSLAVPYSSTSSSPMPARGFSRCHTSVSDMALACCRFVGQYRSWCLLLLFPLPVLSWQASSSQA